MMKHQQKQVFLETMEAIKKQKASDDKRHELLCQALNSCLYIEDQQSQFLIPQTIELLAHMVGDKSDLIDYFIYDCEFGKKDMTFKIDGVIFPLRTPNQLYKAITVLKEKK